MYPVWGREGAKSWIASGWIVWEEELISGEGGRGKVLPPPRPSLVWTAGARKRSAVGVRSEVRALLCFAVVVWWLAGWLLFPPPSPEKHGCLLSSLAPLFARQQAAGSSPVAVRWVLLLHQRRSVERPQRPAFYPYWLLVLIHVDGDL
jgi:hypothetical protein